MASAAALAQRAEKVAQKFHNELFSARPLNQSAANVAPSEAETLILGNFTIDGLNLDFSPEQPISEDALSVAPPPELFIDASPEPVETPQDLEWFSQLLEKAADASVDEGRESNF